MGEKIARERGTRLIDPDGSFNVVRRGQSLFAPYQYLVEMSWRRFMLVTVALYIAINVLFAFGFLAIGVDHLTNVDPEGSWWYRFTHCFFFSIQTFTTVGYGQIAPMTVSSNALAAFHALVGWIALALVTGLFFARFSRPSRVIRFSQKALVGRTGEDRRGLMFRMVNLRDGKLINVSARVVLTWLDQHGGELRRRFAPLTLERDHVPLFPLNWTVVHPIDENSPINGWTYDDFCRNYAELLISVDAYDEVTAQTIHLNNSYIHSELLWNHRFEPMYREASSTTELFLDMIDEVRKE